MRNEQELPRLIIFAPSAVLWVCPQCKAQLSLDRDECPDCHIPRPFTFRTLYKNPEEGASDGR